jgi:hypothetical protein
VEKVAWVQGKGTARTVALSEPTGVKRTVEESEALARAVFSKLQK